MPAVKSSQQIAEKWGRVTPQRSQDYKDGVQTPRKDWAENTAAAKNAYNDGVQQAIAEDRFSQGVARAGTGKWQRKASSVGSQRWGPGVAAAQGDYESGFRPYRQVIESTQLPPRYAKGDPRNIERVAAMASALHEAKVGGVGG